jgi:hypothetical protein
MNLYEESKRQQQILPVVAVMLHGSYRVHTRLPGYIGDSRQSRDRTWYQGPYSYLVRSGTSYE